MDAKNLFIVNFFDKPCERLIAEKRSDGKLYYIHPDLKESWKDKGMNAGDACSLEDLGLSVSIFDGRLKGEKNKESVAKYSDGRTRQWQGQNSFSFKI